MNDCIPSRTDAGNSTLQYHPHLSPEHVNFLAMLAPGPPPLPVTLQPLRPEKEARD